MLTFAQRLTDIADKILSIVCDNASNNDTMIEAINLDGFRGAESHVWCFPHILNLSVKVLWLLFCMQHFILAHAAQGYSFTVCNKLGNTETPAAPKSKKMHTMAKRQTCTQSMATSAQGTGKIVTTSQTRSTDSDSGNGGGGFSADDDDNDGDNDNVTTIDDVNPLDTLDQDDDVIQAAEEAQQEDLNEAVCLANLEIMVTNGEWEAASTALSKISSVTSKYETIYWSFLTAHKTCIQDQQLTRPPWRDGDIVPGC